jgi:hypothetical protein
MPRFAVFCPAAPPLPALVRLQVDAEHWLGALKAGQERTGREGPPVSILCDVQADGAIQVADPQGSGVFYLRELRDPPPAAAGVRPALPAPQRAAAAPGARAAKSLPEAARGRYPARTEDLLLVRPGGSELEFAVVRGPASKRLLALRPVVPVGSGVVGYCVRENVALAVSDARNDSRFLWAIAMAIEYETRSIPCAPIAREGKVLGALEVLNKRGRAPFCANDLAALTALARHAADHLARHGG